MATNKKQYKNMKLQYHSGRYTLTIPEWMVEKVLCAGKGSIINFDFSGNKLILENQNV